MTLAVTSYQGAALTDRPDMLNLAWTLDEREWLACDVPAVIARELACESQEGLPTLSSYLVDDPHGERSLAPAILDHFGLSEASVAITCGAGVNALLQAASYLAVGGRVCIIGDVYPDFPHWVESLGVKCTSGPADAQVVLLERPNLTGDSLTHHDVRMLCAKVAPAGGVVVVDESYSNYHDPAFSVASEIHACPNLAVLRGLSKGYWMGSLRLGYCLSSRELANRLRAHLAPMGVSSLSLRLGRALLAQGPIAGTLRARVKVAQAQMAQALASSGFPMSLHHAEGVPYMFCGAEEDIAFNWLHDRGVLVKRQPFWESGRGRVSYKIRVSTPLREERMQQFLRCLGRAVDVGA